MLTPHLTQNIFLSGNSLIPSKQSVIHLGERKNKVSDYFFKTL